MSGQATPGWSGRYEARDGASQYNASGSQQTINNYGDRAGVIGRPWMAPPLAVGLIPRLDESQQLMSLMRRSTAGTVAVCVVYGTGIRQDHPVRWLHLGRLGRGSASPRQAVL